MGYEYQLTSSFSFGTELNIQLQSDYDTSEESTTIEDLPEYYDEVLFPDALSGAGVQLNILFGYHF